MQYTQAVVWGVHAGAHRERRTLHFKVQDQNALFFAKGTSAAVL